MTAAISSKTIEPSAELPDYKLIAKKKAIPHSKVQLPAINLNYIFLSAISFCPRTDNPGLSYKKQS